jgi:hypothetical protein
LNPWEKGVWFLSTGLTAAVVVKLWLSGLARIYQLLFVYLAYDFLSSLAGIFIPQRTVYYGYYYFTAQTLKILIAAFMLMEIYSLALERHPALANFGRSTVGYLLAAAGLIPLIGVWVDHSASAGTHPYLRAYLVFERTMDATMAIFLILISLFMAWFPVRMRRNVIVYVGGFIAWSLSRSAHLYIVSHWLTDKKVKLALDIVQLCIAMGCLLFWLLAMRREGELQTAVVGHLWNRAEAERLTEQLDAINEGLERLRRK